jgi:hypothetical protein
MIDAERAASCEGKDPFDSPQQAWAVLAKSKSARQVYRCRFCGKFHIAG